MISPIQGDGMSAVEPLHQLVGLRIPKLKKNDEILLEVVTLLKICAALKDFFKELHKDYFAMMKLNKEEQDEMIETNFTRLILEDILANEAYNIHGIANYTGTHEDVVQEVIDGRNASPSARFFRKSIELHFIARRDLYSELIKKIGKML